MTSVSRAIDKRMEVETIDHLVREASRTSWSITRISPTYFRATQSVPARIGSGQRVVEISVAIIGGRLKASRLVVVNHTNTSDELVDWFEKGAHA